MSLPFFFYFIPSETVLPRRYFPKITVLEKWELAAM